MRKGTRRLTLLGIVAAVVVGAGCGDDESGGNAGGGAATGGGAGTDSGGSAGTGGSAGAGGGASGAGGTSGSGGSGGSSGSGGVGNLGGAGPAASIIPAERRVVWAPGIPGGIPERTTVCATVTDAPYNAAGDGVADDRGAIQAALDACPFGEVVYAPAGTYRLTDGLAIPSGVTLRGDGPGLTRIEGDNTSTQAIVQAGSWDEANSPVTQVVGGLERGSTSLVLASTAEFVVGDFVIVDQLNDDDLVRAAGEGADPGESPCLWGSREDGTRLLGQISEITSVDPATGAIAIDPPLAMPLDASLSPEIQRVRAQMTRDVGIEDLTVADRTYRGDNRANIRFWGVAYSWIRNVETADVSGRHIQLTKTFRCEVRDSYVHHAHDYNPGANAYGISVENQTTDALVENNIVYFLNAGLMLNSSGPGNVIAYNYTDAMFAGDPSAAPWLMADLIGNHCAHPFMSLLEGNMGSQISSDNIHGSSSHQTFFRNHIDRQHTGFDHSGNLSSVVFAANNRYMNVVGNVLGKPGDSSLPGAVYEQDTGNCLGIVSVYKLGYPSNCANDTIVDPQVAQTVLRHGNHDYVSDAVVWDPDIAEQVLPPSLYLDAAPDYFGAVPWPPIGPDVPGLVSDIPAKLRFDQLP